MHKVKTTLKDLIPAPSFFFSNNPLLNQPCSTTAKDQIADEMQAGGGAMAIGVNAGSGRQEETILERFREV